MFGAKVCNAKAPEAALKRITEGMERALREAKSDDRVPRDLLARMREVWDSGRQYARAEGAGAQNR
ncbi:MAG TPA: hypothetical protein PKB14_19870 [Rubrivivax sp.]|nr:hypothetical protein [Rubrivivax sp.]